MSESEPWVAGPLMRVEREWLEGRRRLGLSATVPFTRTSTPLQGGRLYMMQITACGAL
jgi:hypothetical protein